MKLIPLSILFVALTAALPTFATGDSDFELEQDVLSIPTVPQNQIQEDIRFACEQIAEEDGIEDAELAQFMDGCIADSDDYDQEQEE
ncbi:MAG: hypothetical protein ACI89U_003163 [Gammaproteobacteria bacterium]|jgi:hypothetical protein